MADKTQIPDRVRSYATSDGSLKLHKGTVHPSLLEFNFLKLFKGNNKLKADIPPSVVPHTALAGAVATLEPSASGHTRSASCP